MGPVSLKLISILLSCLVRIIAKINQLYKSNKKDPPKALQPIYNIHIHGDNNNINIISEQQRIEGNNSPS